MMAAAEAMRGVMTPLEHAQPLVFDLSSALSETKKLLPLAVGVAPIVAAAGVPVVLQLDEEQLHRRSTAALQALGVPPDMTPSANQKVLELVGVASVSARLHHPGLGFLAACRRELGMSTMVDSLGPLTNPASATHHLVGVASDTARPRMARTLAALGSRRA